MEKNNKVVDNKEVVTVEFNAEFKATKFTFNGGMVNKVNFPACEVVIPSVAICGNELNLSEGFTTCYILPNEVTGITITELESLSTQLKGFKLVCIKADKKTSITVYRELDKMVLLGNCSAQTFIKTLAQLLGISTSKIDNFYQKSIGRVSSANANNQPKISNSDALSKMTSLLG